MLLLDCHFINNTNKTLFQEWLGNLLIKCANQDSRAPGYISNIVGKGKWTMMYIIMEIFENTSTHWDLMHIIVILGSGDGLFDAEHLLEPCLFMANWTLRKKLTEILINIIHSRPWLWKCDLKYFVILWSLNQVIPYAGLNVMKQFLLCNFQNGYKLI